MESPKRQTDRTRHRQSSYEVYLVLRHRSVAGGTKERELERPVTVCLSGAQGLKRGGEKTEMQNEKGNPRSLTHKFKAIMAQEGKVTQE